MKDHINNNHKIESCPNCKKQMPKKRLVDHKRFCIGKDPITMFSCTSCDYKAKRKYSLDMHIKRHHEEDILHCDKCDYTTKRIDYLNNHKYYMHVNVKKVKEGFMNVVGVNTTLKYQQI